MMLMGWGGELPMLMNSDFYRLNSTSSFNETRFTSFVSHFGNKRGVLPLICWVHTASFSYFSSLLTFLSYAQSEIFTSIRYKRNNYLSYRYTGIIFFLWHIISSEVYIMQLWWQESHIHSLMNVLRYCNLDESLQGEDSLVCHSALERLYKTKELDYMSNIVLRMFENTEVVTLTIFRMFFLLDYLNYLCFFFAY